MTGSEFLHRRPLTGPARDFPHKRCNDWRQIKMSCHRRPYGQFQLAFSRTLEQVCRNARRQRLQNILLFHVSTQNDCPNAAVLSMQAPYQVDGVESRQSKVAYHDVGPEFGSEPDGICCVVALADNLDLVDFFE